MFELFKGRGNKDQSLFVGDGWGYIIPSHEVEIPRLSDATLARMGEIGREFVHAWNNPSPLQDGLQALRADDPISSSWSEFFPAGESPNTIGELLERM